MQNGVDEYFTNQKSSGALNWFDLDGNIFVSYKELSYQGYFFGEDISHYLFPIMMILHLVNGSEPSPGIITMKNPKESKKSQRSKEEEAKKD